MTPVASRDRLRTLVQLAGLCSLYAACRWIVALTHLPVPPGLLALLLLLTALLSRVLPESSVAHGADALLRILGMLFVPAGIGVLRQLPTVRAHALALAAVLLVGLFVGQWVAAKAAGWGIRAEERR
jgi:holin-like protein